MSWDEKWHPTDIVDPDNGGLHTSACRGTRLAGHPLNVDAETVSHCLLGLYYLRPLGPRARKAVSGTP
jgi:hypothetical protein